MNFEKHIKRQMAMSEYDNWKYSVKKRCFAHATKYCGHCLYELMFTTPRNKDLTVTGKCPSCNKHYKYIVTTDGTVEEACHG